MKTAIFSNSEDASTYLAERIIRKIQSHNATSKGPFVMGLPTGSSPEGIYAKLIAAHKEGRISFKNVITFNMDEYLKLPPTNEQSYHYFMFDKFFNHIDIPRENINILNGMAEDVELECSRYENKIKSFGRINFFLGGLGPEGHIAFNEAGSSRESITRKVVLVESTIKANSRFFDNDESKVPKYALSVGISTVLDNSDEVAIIVLGKNKQFAFDKTINGSKNDPKYPSTYLQAQSNVLIVSDNDAAGIKYKL